MPPPRKTGPDRLAPYPEDERRVLAGLAPYPEDEKRARAELAPYPGAPRSYSNDPHKGYAADSAARPFLTGLARM